MAQVGEGFKVVDREVVAAAAAVGMAAAAAADTAELVAAVERKVQVALLARPVLPVLGVGMVLLEH